MSSHIVTPAPPPINTPSAVSVPVFSSSLTTIPDLIEWLRIQADRMDQKALANIGNGREFMRYRRMAAAARETADWYAIGLKGGRR